MIMKKIKYLVSKKKKRFLRKLGNSLIKLHGFFVRSNGIEFAWIQHIKE